MSADHAILAHAGRMYATPIAGNSAQALETLLDDVSGVESPWGVGNGGASGGWQRPQLVAKWGRVRNFV